MKVRLVYRYVIVNHHVPEGYKEPLHTEVIDTEIDKRYDGVETIEDIKKMFCEMIRARHLPRVVVEECAEIN